MSHNSRLSRIYWCMMTRCYFNSHKEHTVYNRKGITVCTEWLDKERTGVHNTSKGFAAFREWALKSGYKDGLTLDRINNDKGYCPENCRWVTMTVQQNNRSNNHVITYDGVTLTMSEWNSKLGYPRGLIEKRLRRGWTIQKALTQCPRIIKRRIK